MERRDPRGNGGGVKVEPSDIAEDVRQMGREDYLANELEPPFGETSVAHQHWWEGVEQARQFPLLAIAETEIA